MLKAGEYIETERLILRRFREEDLQDLYGYLSDEETVKFEPYRPMDIAEMRQEPAERMATEEMIAAVLKESGRLIGNIYPGRRDFAALEPGYVFNQHCRGRGCAQESCRLSSKSFCGRLP